MDFEGYPLLNFESFNQRFEELLPEYPTYQQAFEAVEKEVEQKYNHRAYKSYESFKSTRAYHLNGVKNKRRQKSHKWNETRGYGRS